MTLTGNKERGLDAPVAHTCASVAVQEQLIYRASKPLSHAVTEGQSCNASYSRKPSAVLVIWPDLAQLSTVLHLHVLQHTQDASATSCPHWCLLRQG